MCIDQLNQKYQTSESVLKTILLTGRKKHTIKGLVYKDLYCDSRYVRFTMFIIVQLWNPIIYKTPCFVSYQNYHGKKLSILFGMNGIFMTVNNSLRRPIVAKNIQRLTNLIHQIAIKFMEEHYETLLQIVDV